MPVDQVCSIETWEPCNDTYPSSLSSSIDAIGQAADVLDAESKYWHKDVSLTDSQVTLAALKKLGINAGNEIIIWHGHGTYYSDKGEVLFIGEKCSSKRRMSDKEYNYEFTSGNVVFYYSGNMAITPKFIKAYCNNLDGSLVYLGACWSGYDSKLAEAFISKGAKAVVGFSQSVTTAYDCAFALEFAKALCEKKSNGRFSTASEALAKAKDVLGSTDAVRYRGGGATANLFGDGDFRFDESLDDVYTAYLEKVQEYQARYGEHSVKRIKVGDGEMDAVAGLGLVDIIDFDGDGTDELVLGYGDESKFNSTDVPFDAFTLEVWGYESGKVKQLYTVGPHNGAGGPFESADAIMFGIMKSRVKGKPSYIRSVSGDTITYNTLKNGSFTTVDTLRMTLSGEYYVNGSKVSESEYGKADERYFTDDFEFDSVLLGDFMWNGEPYDFELEVFIDTDNAIGRLMIGTTDAADEDYRDNNGYNEKTG